MIDKKSMHSNLRSLCCLGRDCSKCKISEESKEYNNRCSKVPFETYLKYAHELYISKDETIFRVIESIKEDGEMSRFRNTIALIGGVQYE